MPPAYMTRLWYSRVGAQKRLAARIALEHADLGTTPALRNQAGVESASGSAQTEVSGPRSQPYFYMADSRATCYPCCMPAVGFDWDPQKDLKNQANHGVAFEKAQYAFADRQRVIAVDRTHSSREKRYYCFGKVEGGVLTVRFTYPGNVIRIIGAGYWRKGKQVYEGTNPIHRRTHRATEGDP